MDLYLKSINCKFVSPVHFKFSHLKVMQSFNLFHVSRGVGSNIIICKLVLGNSLAAKRPEELIELANIDPQDLEFKPKTLEATKKAKVVEFRKPKRRQ